VHQKKSDPFPLVRPIPVGIRRSVRYVFSYFLRAAEGELQLLLPRAETYAGRCWWATRIMPADEICIVGRKVAEEVVKRSFRKRGTIREHQEIGLLGIPCPRTSRELRCLAASPDALYATCFDQSAPLQSFQLQVWEIPTKKGLMETGRIRARARID
jgi:hypothetical protein